MVVTTINNSSKCISQQIYKAYILTKHETYDMVRWLFQEKYKAHLANN